MAKVSIYPAFTENDEIVRLRYIGEGVNMTFYGERRRYRLSAGLEFDCDKVDVEKFLNTQTSQLGKLFVRVREKPAAKVAAPASAEESAEKAEEPAKETAAKAESAPAKSTGSSSKK